MTIEWTQFDWPSFATSAAGAMAVGGAIVIDRRQLEISFTQAEILKRQAETPALTLRATLFDRRYRSFDDVRTFLAGVVQIANEPERATIGGLLAALRESQLHFWLEVTSSLTGIWVRSSQCFARRAAFKADLLHAMTADAINQSRAMFQSLTKDLENLVELFGDELRLTDVEA